MQEYHTELNIRIDWSELDLFGHVNNVSFFKYMQSARVNYWDLIGLSERYTSEKVGPMLVSASCQFKKPLFYPGNIRILTKVDFIKNSSFGFTHLILDGRDEVSAEAQDVMVLFDFNTNLKMPVPRQLRDNIEEREGKVFG